jgi:hypothetical protein
MALPKLTLPVEVVLNLGVASQTGLRQERVALGFVRARPGSVLLASAQQNDDLLQHCPLSSLIAEVLNGTYLQSVLAVCKELDKEVG